MRKRMISQPTTAVQAEVDDGTDGFKSNKVLGGDFTADYLERRQSTAPTSENSHFIIIVITIQQGIIAHGCPRRTLLLFLVVQSE